MAVFNFLNEEYEFVIQEDEKFMITGTRAGL